MKCNAKDFQREENQALSQVGWKAVQLPFFEIS